MRRYGFQHSQTQDSLFNVSQSFLSPDILQKISREINQPIEQTKAGLKAAIPTLLMGIINKGSTKEGAESLVIMTARQTAAPEISMNEANLHEGNEFVKGIFEGNFETIVANLGKATGMNTMSIKRMLGLSAPLIMGAIGTKIRSEKMSITSLMNFLKQQKSSLVGLIPAGIPGIQNKETQKIQWARIVLVGVLLAGVFWWFNSPRFVSHVDQSQTITQILDTSKIAAEPIAGFEAFMNSDVTMGPIKRFRMQKISFKTGSITLFQNGASDIELNRTASMLKAYPNAMVRIETFTDGIGSESNNQIISNKRALAVKAALVSRGVQVSRIETLGRGANDPIGSNKTEKGRTLNRRVELIIKR